MHTEQEYRELVDKYLVNFIPSVDPKVHTIYESMRYSLLSGGKRLRPILLLAACEFAGGDMAEAMPYACALEYIHTYSLIHDDLPAMDDDDLRRGNPTNHKVYGEAMAILAGDALLNTAYESMIKNLIYYFDDQAKLRNHIRATLAIAKDAGINGMIAGQVCDVENEHCQCSLEMVEFMDEHKTGKLICAPIIAGLKLGGADPEVLSDFEAYAMDLGTAFQISDDILDIRGDRDLMGKSVGGDEEKGKCNYACLNGIKKAEEDLHMLTERAIGAIAKYDGAEFFIELAKKLEKREA